MANPAAEDLVEAGNPVGAELRVATVGASEELADFFLVPGDPTQNLKAIKTISMVVKDGTFYFPSEVYPKFGVQPFIAPPAVTEAAKP